MGSTPGSPAAPWWPAASLAAAGVVVGAITALLVAGSDILLDPGISAATRTGFVVANVAGGAYTWWRRPASGFGPLFALVGLMFAATSLNAIDARLPFTVGRALYAAVMVTLVYVFLCFPGARLSGGRDRRFVTALIVAASTVWAVLLAVAVHLPAGGPFSDCGAACPRNALRFVDGAAELGRVLGGVANTITIASLLIVAVLLLIRMRGADLIGRRSLAPLFVAMSALLVALASYTFARQVLDDRVPALSAAVAVTILCIPVAILLGQVRGRLFTARRLGSLVADVGDAPVTGREAQALVADALGDPSLTLGRWDAERDGYYGVDDQPLDAGHRTALELTRDGRPYAIVVYDPAIDHAPEVVRGVAATGLMLLENARLVGELRASRSRIAAATHDGRVRVERDLHDGVQPHLNALLIKLGIAGDIAGDGELHELIDEIGRDAATAVDELRRLARGIYPPVLRERGVADALRAFATTAPVRIRVEDRPAERSASAAEEAVYFTALEAIQNAIKHGGAGVQVAVTLERRDGTLAFSITDDGPGFDRDPDANGVGLVSMDDRVSALDGALEIASTPGSGTVVRGWVPAAG